ncbi:hypothetical protein PENDEC_c031G03693 [Penicillium decumbens]|uniref:Uncharacterized protein n=1 Tax=Penicillium decumbens TaxID=69771 RepID=A0A1V6NVQ7_PENDC|nr:hypothetical protein PENDEC_c031G03693 [Penicillium decumbens]
MSGEPSPEELQPPWDQSGETERETSNNPGSSALSATGQPVQKGQQETAHTSNSELSRCPRRFLAQPIETSSRSSQTRPTPSTDSTGDREDAPDISSTNAQADRNQPRRRFLPQPIETTKSSNPGTLTKAQTPEQNPPTGPRRFKPEVIETDRRSVKGISEELSHGPTSPGSRPAASNTMPRINSNRTGYTELPESKFSYASLLRRQEGRRHSFRVPELPPIPSSGSEDSDDEPLHSPSLSSHKSPQKSTGDQKPERLLRESCDGEYTEYLLSLAARSAQKQLREQALAAFPNEQVHEPVDHFAIDSEDEEEDLGERAPEDDLKYPQKHHIKSRRESSADLSWELEYMRQHKEEAEMRLRAMAASKGRDHTSAGYHPAPRADGRTSPPMLGDDIVLPRSLSPVGTRCENSTAEDGSHAAQDSCRGGVGLWYVDSRPDDDRGTGLWKGTCSKSHSEDGQRASGIMTPMPRGDDTDMDRLSRSSTCTNLHGMTSQPGPRKDDFLSISSKSLEDEFNDAFVTQIYNYLSLGYPCVARYYDYELSKISGIAIQDLRRDDLHTDARGYVVAMEGNPVTACTRWRALRRYIREWARQQPRMAEDDTGLEAWGMPERKGSWAI